MKVYIFPVVLQVLGILVIVAEIFIPSMGLLSLLAAGLIFYSLFLAFNDISQAAGMVFVGADLILVPILIYVGIRALAASPLSLQRKLSSREGVISQSPDLDAWADKTGEAMTDLRPSGMALIEGKRLDVITDGEYVTAGTRIGVAGVKGNQIIVEKLE
ncbi:NfeD family protein [Desulfospira joergensenii]|uniref:NfeD family protein n=1 Tax=Desulfospira joergensenii TaxID=53329 RepID=UPI0003B769C3|nr:NfeD family protein [Desulfospira joergensenii]